MVGPRLHSARRARRDRHFETLRHPPSDTRWAYKWARNFVHPQVVGITIGLGLPALRPGSLSGPSILGLDWPGHAAMASLQHCTVAVATLRLNDEPAIRVNVFTYLTEEASSAFKAADQIVEANQPAMRNEVRTNVDTSDTARLETANTGPWSRFRDSPRPSVAASATARRHRRAGFLLR